MSEASIAKSRTRPNYLYAILSVALVLFLLGFFALVLLHAQELIKTYKEQVNITLELEDPIQQVEIEELIQKIKAEASIIDTSVVYLSKEDAALLMKEEFGEDFQYLGLPNPFPEMITFNVNAAHLHPDSLIQIKEKIEAFDKVALLSYQEGFIDEVSNNLSKIAYIAIGIGIFFFIVALSLIHNTIRLALYSNRFLIKNMQLVGASWLFISRPYILRALGHGFIASVLAISTLSALLFWVRREIPQLTLIDNPMTFIYLLLLLVPLGMCLYGLSTYRVVYKYLTMRVDDLY